jgi:cation transport regulator ChaC
VVAMKIITWGVAYYIGRDKVDEVLSYLDYREKVRISSSSYLLQSYYS